MRKQDLTATQLRDLSIFYVILEHHGWVDTEGVELQFDAGEKVSPEGQVSKIYGQTELRAHFHAPVRMISLKITDLILEDQVQFHFLYEKNPESLLEWMCEHSAELTLESYPDLLKDAEKLCAMILMEVSDQEIYEVKPSAEF